MESRVRTEVVENAPLARWLGVTRDTDAAVRWSTSPARQPADTDALAVWWRGDEGFVGIGEAWTFVGRSAAEVDAWWRDVCASTTIVAGPGVPGALARPVALLSFPFDADGEYHMVVPSRLLRAHGGRTYESTWEQVGQRGRFRLSHSEPVGQWGRFRLPHPTTLPERTHVGQLEPSPLSHPRDAPDLDRAVWNAAVQAVLAQIHAGAVNKVVLARTETVSAPEVTSRQVVARLARAYPTTWTYYVHGLIGATPELLVHRADGRITSRVLAGTVPAGTDPAALLGSAKERAEHRYAVESVAGALRPHVADLDVPDEPTLLALPNVLHLASDLTGRANDEASVIALADAIHPSAAVGGTPREAALSLIRALEPVSRGRYAGPIGWIDAAGDGEIGLALRGGQLDGTRLTLYAGVGLVDGSDPDSEWRETEVKLAPMRAALVA